MSSTSESLNTFSDSRREGETEIIKSIHTWWGGVAERTERTSHTNLRISYQTHMLTVCVYVCEIKIEFTRVQSSNICNNYGHRSFTWSLQFHSTFLQNMWKIFAIVINSMTCLKDNGIYHNG